MSKTLKKALSRLPSRKSGRDHPSEAEPQPLTTGDDNRDSNEDLRSVDREETNNIQHSSERHSAQRETAERQPEELRPAELHSWDNPVGKIDKDDTSPPVSLKTINKMHTFKGRLSRLISNRHRRTDKLEAKDPGEGDELHVLTPRAEANSHSEPVNRHIRYLKKKDLEDAVRMIKNFLDYRGASSVDYFTGAMLRIDLVTIKSEFRYWMGGRMPQLTMVGGQFNCENLEHSGRDVCSFLPKAPALEAHNITAELLLLDWVLVIFNFHIKHLRHHAKGLKGPISEYKKQIQELEEQHKETIEKLTYEPRRKEAQASHAKLRKDPRFEKDPLNFVTSEEAGKLLQEGNHKEVPKAPKKSKHREGLESHEDPLSVPLDEKENTDVQRNKDITETEEDPDIKTEHQKFKEKMTLIKELLESEEHWQKRQSGVAEGYEHRRKYWEHLKEEVKKKVADNLDSVPQVETIVERLENLFEGFIVDADGKRKEIRPRAAQESPKNASSTIAQAQKETDPKGKRKVKVSEDSNSKKDNPKGDKGKGPLRSALKRSGVWQWPSEMLGRSKSGKGRVKKEWGKKDVLPLPKGSSSLLLKRHSEDDSGGELDTFLGQEEPGDGTAGSSKWKTD